MARQIDRSVVRDRSAVGGGRACGKSTGDPDEDGPSSLYNIYNVCVMILIAHAILCIILFFNARGGQVQLGAARREAITTATGTLYQYVGDAGLRRHPRIGETFNYHTSGHSLMHEKGRELKEKNGFLLSSIPFISLQDDWMDLY